MKRSVAVAVAVAAMAALAVLLGPAPSAVGGPTPSEAEFVELANSLRSGLGLAAYEVHPELEAKARAWAATMAAAGAISHSRLADGITLPWQRLGENVGMGPSVVDLHDAFVTSPHHLANFTHPGYRFIGVGVAERAGTIYVAQEFMELRASAGSAVAAAPLSVTPAPPVAPQAPSPGPVSPAAQAPTTTPERDADAEVAGAAPRTPGQTQAGGVAVEEAAAVTPLPVLGPPESGTPVPSSEEPGQPVPEPVPVSPTPRPPAGAPEQQAPVAGSPGEGDDLGNVTSALGFFLLGTGVALVGARRHCLTRQGAPPAPDAATAGLSR